ncbi:MAG: hypothetical protein RL060_1268, partial [Bacteroidota bacterium]
LGDEVALEYYRLQKVAENNIALDPQGEYGLDGITEAGIRSLKEEKAMLSEIVDLLNKKFQTEFNEADKLFFDQMEMDCVLNDELKASASSNSIENFKYVFEDIFMNILIERMGQNQDIFTKMMDNKDFGSLVKDMLMKKTYNKLRGVV